MCKKIAQLTKIIFALNTKNEENENINRRLKDELTKEQQLSVSAPNDKVARLENEIKTLASRESEISETFQVTKTQFNTQLKTVQEAAETQKRSLSQAFNSEVASLRERVASLTVALDQLKDAANRRIEATQAAYNQLKSDKNSEIEALNAQHQTAIQELENCSLNQAADAQKTFVSLHNRLASLEICWLLRFKWLTQLKTSEIVFSNNSLN
jgi:adenylosuccinate synthase